MPGKTKELIVGDEAFGSFGQYGAIDVKAGKVTKITPTGQMTIDFGERWPGNGDTRIRRFNASGWEIGAGLDHGGYLIDAETFARLAEKQKGVRARQAVTNLLRSWSFKSKADLNALVARLTELAALVPDDESTK